MQRQIKTMNLKCRVWSCPSYITVWSIKHNLTWSKHRCHVTSRSAEQDCGVRGLVQNRSLKGNAMSCLCRFAVVMRHGDSTRQKRWCPWHPWVCRVNATHSQTAEKTNHIFTTYSIKHDHRAPERQTLKDRFIQKWKLTENVLTFRSSKM